MHRKVHKRRWFVPKRTIVQGIDGPGQGLDFGEELAGDGRKIPGPNRVFLALLPRLLATYYFSG
jgi:hypothetical protein